MKKIVALLTGLCLIIQLGSCARTESSSVPDITTTAITTTTPIETTTLATTAAPTDAERLALQYEEGANERDELYAAFSDYDLPVISITTLDEKKITSRDEYVSSVVDVLNTSEEYELSTTGGVKIRGNSTAGKDPEKPYRIKFDRKENLLGLHNGKEFKSWVLLRTLWNLASDYMAFRLAEELYGGRYYVSDATYVNLWINQEFMGVYLLCEQNQAATGRVEIHEPQAEELQTDVGYFVEIDNYPDEDHPNFKVGVKNSEFTDVYNETREILDQFYSIKSDTSSDEQRKYIERYVNSVFRIVFEAANGVAMKLDDDQNAIAAPELTPQEAVEAVLDVDAAVDMLILQELTHNYDVGAGSFYMAIDFSPESRFTKLTFLAPWDFNWAYGDEPYGNLYAATFQDIQMGYDRSNYWLLMLYSMEWFQNAVKTRWSEVDLVPTVEQVRADVQLFENDLGELAWRVESAGELCDFVLSRIDWFNSEWSLQ